MAHRTFAIGDIHGDLDHLRVLIGKLPLLDQDDTVVFMGDYVDRGPQSKEVVSVVRRLDADLGCNVVCLMGNHEAAWIKVLETGWDAFVLPPGNGCLATLRSYLGVARTTDEDEPTADERMQMLAGSFFPTEVVEWMQRLPFWYEDEHAIYVHAGLIEGDGQWCHPRDAESATGYLWTRSEKFFREYRGKRVVIGHTRTELLPPELSNWTVDDPTDMWAGECVVAIDTGCGKGGFLTALELPSLTVYESR